MCKLASGKNTNRSLAGNIGTCALAARQPCPPGCLAFLVWRDLRLSSSIDGQGLQLLAPHLFPYNSHVALSTTLWQESLRQRQSKTEHPGCKSATTRTRKKLVAKAEILNTHHNNADVTQTSLNPHAQVAKANDQHKMKSRTTNIQCHLHARDHNHEFKTKL